MARRGTSLCCKRMDLVRSIVRRFFPFDRRFFPSPDSGKNPDHWLGRQGEREAERFLRRQSYRILYRNFRAPHGGEVDLVCRDKSCDTLAFVEVKTRSSLDFGNPADAVTRDKQKLIARGALAWLRMVDHPSILFRFEIVEVVVTGQRAKCHLIKDAFSLPEPLIY